MGIYAIQYCDVYVRIYLHIHKNIYNKYTYTHIYLGVQPEDTQPKIALRPLFE